MSSTLISDPVNNSGPQADRAEVAKTQLHLLRRFMRQAPFQPATNLWRCIEVPELASAMPQQGRGLDIGCGDGELTVILQDLAGGDWSLVGVDVDPAETQLAQSLGVYEHVHTTVADTIPEPDNSFDFAFSNSVLEHIDNLPDVLREIHRCLRPGGTLLATVPSPYFHDCLRGPGWTRRITRSQYLEETDKRLAHINYWSAERWNKELRIAGFEPGAISSYLSMSQVRRWEFMSNWTGGLLYRLKKGTQQPIAIQRKLGLRRNRPRLIKFLARPLARFVSFGLRGHTVEPDEKNGCFLVKARKPND